MRKPDIFILIRFFVCFWVLRAYNCWVMPSMDDRDLLREYVENGSDIAFEAILNRHVNLVYSTALRQVREPSLASEVTQTTFIILARKAKSLRRETVLSGWLYRTAQFAAARALRAEYRRRERDQEAAKMQTEQSNSVWEQLAPLLDRAMAHLNDTDRNAIVLRFFENKTAKDVGVALGINEAAAQKRVARAIEKLRGLCTKNGVVVPAIALTAVISANAVQAAPAGIAVTTTTALKGVGISASTATLIKGTLKSIAWAKFKFAALTSLGVTLAAGTIILVEESHLSEPKYQNRAASSWLEQLDDGTRENAVILRWELWQPQAQRSAKQGEAVQAIQGMGTNALPYLLSMLEKKPSRLDGLFGKPVPPSVYHRQAALALEALGPQNLPLIPELTRILHQNTSPKEAAMVLAAIGPEGWEVLTKAIADTNHTASACSIWALGSHRAFVPGTTVEALKAKFIANDPESINALTGWALAEIGQDREQVVSLLISGLQDRRWDSRWGCAVALGRMGRDARSAVPALLAMLKDRDPVMRHDAAQALEQIDPETAAQAGATGALATEHVPKTMPDL